MSKGELLSILAEFVPQPEKIVLELEDVFLIDTTPHEIKFEDGTVIPGSTELAKIVKATPKEKEVKTFGSLKLVTTEFEAFDEALKFIDAIKRFNKTSSKPALIISSLISVNAYGFPVVSPIAVNPRAPPAERKCFKYKWNTRL